MEFENVWKRVKNETRLKSLGDLGQLVGITQQSISARKKKGDFPAEWAFLIAQQYKLSTDWILTGEGEKRTGSGKKATSEYILELEEWLNELISEDERLEFWFQCTIEEAFPKFKHWRKMRKIGEEDFFGEKVHEGVD